MNELIARSNDEWNDPQTNTFTANLKLNLNFGTHFSLTMIYWWLTIVDKVDKVDKPDDGAAGAT